MFQRWRTILAPCFLLVAVSSKGACDSESAPTDTPPGASDGGSDGTVVYTGSGPADFGEQMNLQLRCHTGDEIAAMEARGIERNFPACDETFAHRCPYLGQGLLGAAGACIDSLTCEQMGSWDDYCLPPGEA